MSIASDTKPKIEFVSPLMGFDQHTAFEIEALDDDGMFFTMQSTSDPSLRLVLADPQPFYPDYDAVIDGDTAKSLQIEDEGDGAILAIVNMAQGMEKATMNLFAPIVVNPKAHRAVQAMLYGEDHPLDAPLNPPAG
ncbi:flagellar assembly factor FliW [Kineococcus radiotolerans]|uniref:Flagellar assembly factor FliW n=1 Tax=Kineococcus radiotolerans TaxID=131568 RepID=A0A7W4XV60_KINRA|nr:flagellar assembly protein FliW [Kineococcus radiotolerans]MBB2899686.1 flagellar assembly factor FliW [Kineococcus radiotolerans]